MKRSMNLHSSFQSVSDLDFAISAKMVGESPPEKRLKLEDANNHEQLEIQRLKEVEKELKEVVKKQEEMLASRNKKLLEMEKSKNKVEREKSKFEAKLQKLVECPVCLTLPRAGPVPCCANGHLVCSPCLGKLREENKLEQG